MALTRTMTSDLYEVDLTRRAQVKLIDDILDHLKQSTAPLCVRQVAVMKYIGAGFSDRIAFEEKIFAPLAKRLKEGGDHHEALVVPKKVLWHKDAAPWTKAGTGADQSNYGLAFEPYKGGPIAVAAAKSLASPAPAELPASIARGRSDLHEALTERAGKKFLPRTVYKVAVTHQDTCDQLAEAMGEIKELRQNAKLAQQTIHRLVYQLGGSLMMEEEERPSAHRTN
jgi:hypothetical protein